MILQVSNPCRGVSRGLGDSDQRRWAPVIAARNNWKDVKVLQLFQVSNWRIVYLDNAVTDNPYLFFSGDPAESQTIVMLGGGAALFDYDDILGLVLSKVPGIPERLAECFAWHVTFSDD